MPIPHQDRRKTARCDSCGQYVWTASIFINGAGWFDFCTECDDDDEFAGPPRAYTGPSPIPAGAA